MRAIRDRNALPGTTGPTKGQRAAAIIFSGKPISPGMPRILTCGTTTLSAPDSLLETERLQALPRLSRDEGEPVFAEPWQAQAFALAVKLSEQGDFTWQEWAAALTSELKAPFRCTAVMSQLLRRDPTAPEKVDCLT